MRELHVVALSEDGRHVVLATTPDASKGGFRVVVDDRLLAAVKGELPRPGEQGARRSAVSVKQIQARLRAGESVESVARAAGLPVTRVERFSWPILSEREQVVQAAREAVLVRGKRGPSALALGAAVDQRLAELPSMRPDSVAWTAFRGDAPRWTVQVSWFSRGHTRTGQWLYDPATRGVAAQDPASAALAHVEPGPLRRRGDGDLAEGAEDPARPAARPRRATGTRATTRATGRSTTTRPQAEPDAPARAPRTATSRRGPSPTGGLTAAAAASRSGAASPRRPVDGAGPAERVAEPARRAAPRPAPAAAARPDSRRRAGTTPARHRTGDEPQPVSDALASGAASGGVPRTAVGADGVVVPAPGGSTGPRRVLAGVLRGADRDPSAGDRAAVHGSTSKAQAGSGPTTAFRAAADAPGPDAPADRAEAASPPGSDPAAAASTRGRGADPSRAGAPAARDAAPPSGPPALRVVPPVPDDDPSAAPVPDEPVAGGDPQEQAPAARGTRRGRASVPSWSDVLLSTAPPQGQD